MKTKLLSLFVALIATTALGASNTITYTADAKLTRSSLNVGQITFGPAIISHTFSNGTGTITCGGEITTIGNSAFFYCSGLTSVTIPNSVTTIGDYAFAYCSGLTSITIPNSVTTTGDYAFEYCSGLTSVTIPHSVTTIGLAAFAYCSGLTSVTIPNSVTTTGDYAFQYCEGLTSITIPNSVTTIGDYAFHNCSSLTSIDVDAANKHYTSVDGVLFNYAKDTLIQYPIGNPRTKYTIPNSVTTIGNSAFCRCSGLTLITIPNSVTTIGEDAFYGCSGLTSITCYATTPPTCGSYCFYDVDKSIPVYVPAGSVEAYKSSKQWKDFYNIHPITAQEVEVTEIEAEPTESTVEIAWPIVVDAETYTIEIRLGDQLICSIVFNAQGQLLSINFNPAPGRGHTYAKTAEGTATGWAYTIAGLNPGTNYTYSVVAKDATDQVIDTKNGLFTTTAPTGLLDVNDNSKFLIQNSKLIKNGHLYILRDNNLYNATGARVK